MPALLPMFHIYGFTVTVLYSIRAGTKLITLPKFTPESYIETIVRHKPNILMLVPPIGKSSSFKICQYISNIFFLQQ